MNVYISVAQKTIHAVFKSPDHIIAIRNCCKQTTIIKMLIYKIVCRTPKKYMKKFCVSIYIDFQYNLFLLFFLSSNNKWNLCPIGYFLNGLGRSKDNFLHNIEYGHCCKPSNHPNKYGSCYDEDVGKSFDQEGWSICSKAGYYYITGLYRGSGNNWLNNIDKFRCCEMIK